MACVLLGCASLLLASCNVPPSAQLESVDQVDLRAKNPRRITNRGDGAALRTGATGSRYEVFPGSRGSLLEDGEDPPPGVGEQQDGKFTVNVDQASVAEAAKLILGETLGYNYVLDPRVQGSVTLVSNRPLTARELLSAFEAALKLAGASLIQSDSTFKIVVLQEVLEGEMGTADRGKNIADGYGVSAIPLRYIAPATLMELRGQLRRPPRFGARHQGRKHGADPRPGGGAQGAGRSRAVLRRRLDEEPDDQHRHSRKWPGRRRRQQARGGLRR